VKRNFFVFEIPWRYFYHRIFKVIFGVFLKYKCNCNFLVMIRIASLEAHHEIEKTNHDPGRA
jgi:hypothetical protein